jgi:tRNA threonylcarbamoyladenosine biosynthesis protein TsaB
VSVSHNGELAALKELDNGYTHAENLHLFIGSILKDLNLKPSDLSAIAVSKGPGSYTGLRIGVSAAKGMAYALNIPLLSVDTLQIMAAAAKIVKPDAAFYCAMIDARRMEVYTSIYDHELNPQQETEALILDESSVQKFKHYRGICFFGNGMSKSKTLLQEPGNVNFVDDIVPSAKNMCALSFRKFNERQFEDTAYFEPFYLKDFMIIKKN